jgi:hypothetical protein
MENIKVKELFNITQREFDRYSSLFEFVKPSNKLGKYQCKSFLEMTYGEVLNLINCVKSDDWLKVMKCYFPNLSNRKMMNIRSNVFFPVFFWIKSDLESYQKRQKMLQGITDPKLEQAGVERLEVLGAMNEVFNTADLLNFRLDELEKMENLPYSLVFTRLLKEKIGNDIQRDYQELMKHNSR